MFYNCEEKLILSLTVIYTDKAEQTAEQFTCAVCC